MKQEAEVLVEAEVEEGEAAAGAAVGAAVTAPHWVWTVFGHQLEQPSGQGYFQDSLGTWGFSRC